MCLLHFLTGSLLFRVFLNLFLAHFYKLPKGSWQWQKRHLEGEKNQFWKTEVGISGCGGKREEKREPKLNTFVSALTYHKSYENRGLIVFALQVHPHPPPPFTTTQHHHPAIPPTPPPPLLSSNRGPSPTATTSFIQLPADGSCVSSQSAGAALWAPADPCALPHLKFYYLTSKSPPLLSMLTGFWVRGAFIHKNSSFMSFIWYLHAFTAHVPCSISAILNFTKSNLLKSAHIT